MRICPCNPHGEIKEKEEEDEEEEAEEEGGGGRGGEEEEEGVGRGKEKQKNEEDEQKGKRGEKEEEDEDEEKDEEWGMRMRRSRRMRRAASGVFLLPARAASGGNENAKESIETALKYGLASQLLPNSLSHYVLNRRGRRLSSAAGSPSRRCLFLTVLLILRNSLNSNNNLLPNSIAFSQSR